MNRFIGVLVISGLFLSSVSLWAQSAKPAAVPVIDSAVRAAKKKNGEKEFSVAEFAAQLSSTLSSSGIDEALALFDTVPEEFLTDYSIRFMHSSLLLSCGKPKEAEPIAAKLLAEEPKDTEVLFLNAMIAKAQGSRNKKTQYLQSIVKIDPYNAEANAELGNEQMLAKAYKAAKDYFLRSISKDPNYITGLFGYGQVCYYLGETNDARKYFGRVLAINPEEDIAWSYLAKVEAETECYDAAIEDIKKALDINPSYYNYWIDLGDYLRLSGKIKDSIEAFSKAIEINPDYFLGYVYRAGLYEIINDFDHALEDYRSIVKCNPSYHYAYESIGLLAWHSGDWAECRAAYEKAYEKNSENISYPLMISACYQKEGKKLDNKNFLNKLMRGMDRNSVEYAVVRLYFDGLGDADVMRKIHSLDSKNKKGKLLYYMGVFYELNNGSELAKDIFLEIKEMNSPMFFEYRLTEWALEKYGMAKL